MIVDTIPYILSEKKQMVNFRNIHKEITPDAPLKWIKELGIM